MRRNLLKQRLINGETLFGAWVETGSATNTEMLGHFGFDFLVLDLEHGEGGLTEAAAMLRAADTAGTPAIVRVPSNDGVFLKRILDLGARSLMIPGIETGAEAADVVAACHYPPAGRRGYGAPNVRASRYGMDGDYVQGAGAELLLVLQIESVGAVERAAEICTVDGVDVPFLGVNDMAGTIGRLEQLDRPDVRALVARAEQAMKASGKPMGTVPSAGATWQDLAKAGYGLIVCASDVGLMRDAALAMLGEQRRFLGASSHEAHSALRY